MNGLGKTRKIFYKILERFLIKYADVLITVSKQIGKEYQRLYGIEEPIIIYNCPWKRDITLNHDLFREKFKIRKEQIIFLYQGIVSKGRGVEILLETFSKMDTDNAVIVFMGFGPLEDEIKNYSNKFSNIYFQEAVRPPKFLDFTASADYGLSFIEDISLSDRYCLPNKLFEYINAGIPVICSNLPEMKKFVEENGIGVIAKNITIDGLKEAIIQTQNLDKLSLRRKVSDVSVDYCWEAQGLRLLKTYEKLYN
jgi:glycosyltransferase involved in cell wall biosynthesis